MKVMLEESVAELDDMRMTLIGLRENVDKLIKKHGETAIIEADAGSTNVEFNVYCEVTPEEVAAMIRARRSGQPTT